MSKFHKIRQKVLKSLRIKISFKFFFFFSLNMRILGGERFDGGAQVVIQKLNRTTQVTRSGDTGVTTMEQKPQKSSMK